MSKRVARPDRAVPTLKRRRVEGRTAERPSRLYAVTVPYTHVSKAHVYECLDDICDRLCVSEERHYDGQVHHHIYMRTIERLRRKEVREIMKLIYGTVADDGDDDEDDDGDEADDGEDDEGDFDDQYYDDIASRHGGIHITKVRSERNYLKYITKSDREPMIKNIDPQKLSFFYQANQWAKHTPQYDPADAFILNHPQYYNLLKQVHASVRARTLTASKQPLRLFTRNAQDLEETTQAPTVQTSAATAAAATAAATTAEAEAAEVEPSQTPSTTACDLATRKWKQDIIDWWNEFATNGHEHKKKQLYLWGPSNTGKSHFINTLLKACIPVDEAEALADPRAYEKHIFRPTPNDTRFAYEEYDERVHSVMLINEFDPDEYNLSDLKKALEGDSFVIGCKHTSSRRIRIEMPIIFISNMELPDESRNENKKYIGMKSRFNIVDTKYGKRYKN